MKLSIIIPVYNEYKYFEDLITKVIDVNLDYLDIKKEIIIIESNSTDGTRALVEEYRNNPIIKIIYQNKPMGKGNAVIEGFKHVTGDIILIQDADLEYKPEEYPQLLMPILNGNCDFVLGSRHLGKQTWKIREFDSRKIYAMTVNLGSEALNTLFFLLYWVKLTDPQTMYKIFRKKCIKGIKWKSNYFSLDWEIVIKLIKKSYKPIEIPISYKGRTIEQGKKIKLIRDGLLNLWTIIKFRFIN